MDKIILTNSCTMIIRKKCIYVQEEGEYEQKYISREWSCVIEDFLIYWESCLLNSRNAMRMIISEYGDKKLIYVFLEYNRVDFSRGGYDGTE